MAISYYARTSLPLTAGNIECDPRLNKFSVQWKAIQDLKNNDDATLLKISKTVSIVKWFDEYKYYAYQVIAQENSPHTWIIRENDVVAAILIILTIG